MKFSVLLVFVLLVFSTFALTLPIRADAQTQYVSASPGYINFGMETNITVTAPASGSYTVEVVSPTGVATQVTDTFTAAEQAQTTVFGVSASGFKSVVNHVGTYNVFLEQGSTVVSSTSFYATNKINIVMDMVTGGTCAYIAGAERGSKLIPRFHLTYASNGAPVTNSDAGITVTFTAPGNVIMPANWDSGASVFDNAVTPNWNYTAVGPWTPNANASDAAGNVGTFTYSGSPYVISPATLSTTVLLVNSNTNQTITSITSDENITVYAIVTYPTNAEPVSGFVGVLDSATRGGVVSGVVGYGAYNATSNTFSGKSSGDVATVTLSYTGANGIWKGTFSAGTLPTLSSSQTFAVVINAADKASPPNTGTATLNLAPSAPSASSTQTSSTSSSSSSTSTVTTTTSIPIWAYAGTTIALIIGVIVGFLARKK